MPNIKSVKRLLVLVAVALIGALLPTPIAAASSVCREPEPKLRYSTTDVVVVVKVDFRGCSWWRGSSIDMAGEIHQSQLGTGIGQGSAASGGCVALSGGGARSRPPKTRTCTLRLRLEHDAVEASTYSGSVTYPWKDGEGKVEFSYDCRSLLTSASC